PPYAGAKYTTSFSTISKAESPRSFLETKRPPGPIRVIPGTPSGTRTTSNANLTGRNDEALTALKFVRVFLTHRIEVVNFDFNRSSWKPKENDASMSESLVEDQLAEIPIGNNQNALLSSGDC